MLTFFNPAFIYKDPEQDANNFTKLPTLILFTHSDKAFWKNVLTAGKYPVDELTTVSGVGNIPKFGKLFKVLKIHKHFLKVKLLI